MSEIRSCVRWKNADLLADGRGWTDVLLPTSGRDPSGGEVVAEWD